MSDSRAWVPDEAVEALTVRRALQKFEDPVKMSADIIKEHLPLATMSMVHLAIYSNTEMIRFNASKYIMDRAMDTRKGGIPDDKPAWEKIFDSTVVEVNDASD